MEVTLDDEQSTQGNVSGNSPIVPKMVVVGAGLKFLPGDAITTCIGEFHRTHKRGNWKEEWKLCVGAW